MVPPLLRRLEENLALVFGRGMAPFVIRRALRKMGKSEESLQDRDVVEVLREIEYSSLERIYGASARLVAAEVSKHVHRGTTIELATVRSFVHGTTATARAQELL